MLAQLAVKCLRASRLPQYFFVNCITVGIYWAVTYYTVHIQGGRLYIAGPGHSPERFQSQAFFPVYHLLT